MEPETSQFSVIELKLVTTNIVGRAETPQLSVIELNVAATRIVEGARNLPLECYCAILGYNVNSRASEPACQPTSAGAETQF